MFFLFLSGFGWGKVPEPLYHDSGAELNSITLNHITLVFVFLCQVDGLLCWVLFFALCGKPRW